MHIHCLGLNHTTTPIHIREKLSFNEDQVRAALARLGCGGIHSIDELIILSTCNRIELYAVSSQSSFSALENFLSETRGVHTDELNVHLYHFTDSEAVEHLFKVAAGLDSLVLGESQILGQVTKALELARGQNTSGSLLNRLFQAAIHAGKRVRTETAISRNAASVSSLALVAEKIPDVKQAHGDRGSRRNGRTRCRSVAQAQWKDPVINRTLERAQGLAQRWDAESATFEFLQEALNGADILISSTGAPHIILSVEMVRQAMQSRLERPLVLLDIAVPRDIEPEVVEIPHVKLFDIDHLNTHLEQSRARRRFRGRKDRGREMDEFLDFLKSLEMIPLIADLQQQAEAI
jgi:glutamyl-tRNA reductase